MSREAMKMALSTLEGWANHGKWVWPESALATCKRNTEETIIALRAALDAPQPEPVAWMWKDGTTTSDPDRADGTWKPLYTREDV